MTDMPRDDKLPLALLIMRLTLGIFFLQWGVEKFVRPDLAARIFDNFYGMEVAAGLSYAFGVVECALALAMLLGLWKTITYGALLVLHAASVVVSWKQLSHPWAGLANHLFVASVPLLGALVALFLLRARDTMSITMAQLGGRRSASA